MPEAMIERDRLDESIGTCRQQRVADPPEPMMQQILSKAYTEDRHQGIVQCSYVHITGLRNFDVRLNTETTLSQILLCSLADCEVPAGRTAAYWTSDHSKRVVKEACKTLLYALQDIRIGETSGVFSNDFGKVAHARSQARPIVSPDPKNPARGRRLRPIPNGEGVGDEQRAMREARVLKPAVVSSSFPKSDSLVVYCAAVHTGFGIVFQVKPNNAVIAQNRTLEQHRRP